ncbi:hypothetical protein M3194_12300 [Paenibacillus glycanilyticus]|uniref:hypothetical protein n=1 Tax=Paenibacillus glycanilyticus TaxID=126569 RepID=UPI00203AB9B9|nr:hypothetical protein [Paenibacillus glycanilyticus]MCM3628146.1 hypothetical protein [Paenibacillus glycanilyticus]
MRWMKYLGKISYLLLFIMLVANCGTTDKEEGTPKSQAAGTEPVPKKAVEPCMAEIDWVDFLMINNIKYYQNYDGTKAVTEEQLGDKLGEVSYMLNDHACTDHVEKNGDAAFLPIGTVVYALKGYKSEFRVVANNKIYEVKDNLKAATMGELLDIEGKVEKISLESSEDGSPIGDFGKEASTEFVHELLNLENVGFNAVYEKTKHEAGIFLRVHLHDGTSFRMVYYPKANGFTAGAFGSEKLRMLIMSQREQIKSAAGL